MSRRCLVVHPGALGDVLSAGPALSHLHSLGFRTMLAVSSHLVALLAGSGLVDEAVDLERLGLHRLFVRPLPPSASASFEGFDALVLWLGASDPAFRASVAELGRPAIVARAQPPETARRHVSRHLLETLAPLGPVPWGLPPARVHPPEAARARVAGWLADRGIAPGQTVVLQPGAGSPTKAWPAFTTLARRLRARGRPVVALAGPADGPAVAALLSAAALDPDSVARDWALLDIAALFTLARAAVGNDSGPTHLAAAVGCPTVALFGPTDAATWAPCGSSVRVLAGPTDAGLWPEVDQVESALEALVDGADAGASRGLAAAESRAAWR